MANGTRLGRVITRTLNECIHKHALDRMGASGPDEGCSEVLAFHSDVLLAHLAGLWETNTVQKSFPWQMVLAFRQPELQGLLDRMKDQWTFVTTCLDKVSEKDPLHKAIVWTRAQCYRECMTVAESLGVLMFWMKFYT